MADGGLVAARLVSYLLLLVTAGLPLYATFDARKQLPSRTQLALAALAAAAALGSLWWAVANVAAMANLPVGDLDRATVFAVLGATPIGPLLAVRIGLLALTLALLAIFSDPRPPALAASVALATVAWAGHPGAGEGGPGAVLRASDVVHLVGGAVWLGALFAFTSALSRSRVDRDATLASLSRFAGTGTATVAALFASGLANLVLISGDSMPTGTWPLLIGTKAALFVAMLGLAARNRWQLVPAWAEGRAGAAGRLRRSLVLETACGLGVVVAVAAAGLLDPHGG